MNKVAGPRQLSTWRLAAMVLATVLASTSCGGESKKEAAEREQALAAASTAALRVAEHFVQGVLNVSVIDTRTGQLAWTRAVGPQAHALSYAISVAANGVATKQGPPQGLVYLDHGQVRAMALAAPLAAEGIRVSNVADACAIHRLINADASGLVVWALISTQGPDQLCSALDDAYVLVSTTMPASAAPVPSPFAPQALLQTTYSASGQLERLIGYAWRPMAWQFLQIKANGVGTELTNGLISPGQDIQYLGPMPGGARQALVRVGAELRLLDWASEPASLGTRVLLQLKDATTKVAALADANALYVVDAGTVWKVPPSGAATALATLPIQAEVGAGSSQTADYMVLTLEGETEDAVLAVHKRTGAVRELYRAPAASFIQIEAGAGNVIVINEGLAGSPSRAHLSRVDMASSNAPDTFARSVLSLGAIREATGTPEAAAITHVLWCELSEASTRCPSSQIRAQALAGSPVLTLPPSTLPTTWWDEADLNFSGTGAPHVLSLHDMSGPDPVSSLWLLDPDMAGSLRRVK